MRIICPECEAQYEVPDEVIPTEGRDVQCSNCNRTWFVERPGHPGAAQAGSGGASAPKSDPDASRTDDAGGASDDFEDETPPSPPRKELDPEVARILREEARRETEARAADGLEVQPDLGLTQVAASPLKPAPEDEVENEKGLRKPVSTDRDAGPDRTNGAEDSLRHDSAPGVPPGTAPRRDLLPDVDELNSTLRSTGDRKVARDGFDRDTPRQERRRRGFRRGFLVSVVIFVIGVLIYQFAPDIAEAIPQVDPWLSAYVTWADDMRTILDGLVRSFLTWLDELNAPDI